MKKKIALFIITLLVLSSLFAKSNEVYFKFQVDSKDELNKISRIISIDKVENNTIFAYASLKEMAKFCDFNYNYSILPNPSSLVNPQMTDENAKTWTAYPTYEAYISAMNQFALDYPAICTVTNIGNSVDGRELLVAKISDNVNIEEDEPDFFYTGQMHGDEIVDYILLLDLIEYLLSNYGSNTQVDNLINNVEIYINPLSNPDGTYAGGNSSVSGATRYNANSVDLNRNFPDPEDGDHPDGNVYQPENIAMMDFADSHSFILSANLHSGAEVVNYPWDTWSRRHADDIWYQAISQEYATAAQNNSPAGYLDDLENGITNGYDWYSISGGRQDYMNYFKRCRELTLELSTTKLLPASELENHWNYNKESMLRFMEHVLYGIKGTVKDENNNPLSATIEIIGHDIDNSQVFTNPNIGDYHRMIEAGIYDLKFSVAGYDDIIRNDIEVTQNSITTLNITFGLSEITQSFSFDAGWDLISLNVHPIDMTPSSIFSTILSDIIQLKNLTQSYDPSLPDHMNTLTNLADGAGYWINMNASANLNITADPVDFSQTTINLNSGWNLIGYPCQDEQDVTTALSDISAYLIQIKNLTESYDPSLPEHLNTLSQMHTESGYWINVSQNCSFIYPTPQVLSMPTEIAILRDCDWQPTIYPTNSATLYAKINVEANTDDMIGAFANNECRGTGKIVEYNGEFYATITIQLAENAEEINLKYYNSENGNIYECDNNFFADFGEIIGSYPNNLMEINLFPTSSDETVTNINGIELNQNYPNPFNPTTTISFSATKSFNDIEIIISNLKGQTMKYFHLDKCNAGINKIVWNGKDMREKNVSSGIYFYKLKLGNKTIIKKMTLLK